MRFACALLVVLPLAAHPISMSHGLAKVSGATLVYQLRMPEYELVHISNPEQTLFSAIHFSSGGVEGTAVERSCRKDDGLSAFVCDAVYQFPAPVQSLEVRCELFRVTVANHIHLLRATKGGHSDQAIFDSTTDNANLRFRPPTAFETAVKNIAAGVHRAATTLIGLIFIVVLAIAGRSARELAAILGAFLAGQAITCAVLPHVRFDPSPQFIVIAMLLTIAYLLVEIIFLPDGKGRWMVAGVLGLFHGMYYALLLREGEYNAAYVLAGVSAFEVLTAIVVYAIWMRTGGPALRTLVRRSGTAAHAA